MEQSSKESVLHILKSSTTEPTTPPNPPSILGATNSAYLSLELSLSTRLAVQ